MIQLSKPLYTLSFLLIFSIVSRAQTDVDISNEQKYLSISYGYLGSFHNDIGTSGTFKIGWISKSGLGGIIGLGAIEQSRPTITPGVNSTMINASILGGIQFNKIQISPDSPLGAGLELNGIITVRDTTSNEGWEPYYSRGPGLFLGMEITGHLILYKILSVNIGFYTAGLYKEDSAFSDDQTSIASRLLLGFGLNIPLSRK